MGGINRRPFPYHGAYPAGNSTSSYLGNNKFMRILGKEQITLPSHTYISLKAAAGAVSLIDSVKPPPILRSRANSFP
uniref:Uncharacterized protein n=1 Tax=Picea glauca TaxID=3330 RepID=A0A101M1A1_PICGL|nr:hypothetical protein ABT39_MTgene4404 [Picea glauca]QHR86229.1 hypothetical protein Q903MT_gene228 [Picea sitchensis]